MVHFSEEEKAAMSEEKKYRFTHPVEKSKEEKAAFHKKAAEIFKRMQEEAARKQ